ncbi:Flp family type IVb pilin [Marivita sp.]|jgi:pilus assembly protein Flp/PilA|uniref:Flp family type IVb pilin n=1 Tax=Marivita sp. TaxID=2003365 RepID=UPI0023B71E8B
MTIKSLKAAANNFINDESGATAIEYGLIAGLIAVAIVAVLNTVGGNLLTTFTAISNALL